MTEIVPKIIAAGINFNAKAWRNEFSGAEWSLVLLLRGPSSLSLIAGREGENHVWDIQAKETSAWIPGVYAYEVRASTLEGEAVTVEAGNRTITPDFASLPAGTDIRSKYRIGLDSIEAVLAKRATLDQKSYRINNRELERMSVDELLRLRAFYQQKVNEEAGGRRSWFRDLPVRTRPIGR